MSRYIFKFNGKDLTDLVGVRTVEADSLPLRELSKLDIWERTGSVFNGVRNGDRNITVTFLILVDRKQLREEPTLFDDTVREIKSYFYTDGPAQLCLGRDDIYINAILDGTLEINELGDGVAECVANFVCNDPMWYSQDQVELNNNDNAQIEISNESDVDVYPRFSIGFSQDCSFCKIENQTTGQMIQIGGIPSLQATTIKADTKILNDPMESTTGWVASSAPIDPNRVTGGTVAVSKMGTGLCIGSLPSGEGMWKGACYKKILSKTVKDFKVRVRMSHNSSGTNGDPAHPYRNDTSDATSGTKTTYYKVTANVGLILRKSATTSSAKLLTIPYGTKVYPTSTTNGWAKVTYNNKTGYCYMQYLKKYTSDSTVTAKQRNYVTVKSTAIRTTASKSATNQLTIPPGKCIRCYYDTKYPTTGDDNVKGKFFKLATKYEGKSGYVWIDNLVTADSYTVDYPETVITADDKTGLCEIYGYSANNVQLFRMGMYDDNDYYEFSYPVIRRNNTDFLVDKTVAPAPKSITTYSGSGDSGTKKTELIKSGRYGSWNEFYGELYIERNNNKWKAYVHKIKDGEVVKILESNTVVDDTNKDEELSYLVIYVGTSKELEKASGVAISHVEVKNATAIPDETLAYNKQQFSEGDILYIDNNEPIAKLNNVERNDLIDIGSSFFPLKPGDNIIKFSGEGTLNVDIEYDKKYL